MKAESADDLRERITRRAYELYQSRGGEPGHELEDWLQAESEILASVSEQATHLSGEISETIE